MENNNILLCLRSPTKDRIEITEYDLKLPAWSLESLKSAAIELRLGRPRSLAWAIMLNALPPPSGDIISSLETHRNFYNDLKCKLSMDPRAVIGDDPLSQNDESAWKQHFCDIELKALILQDVVRTFPDEVYFREKEVQDLMVDVLFFWARSHSHVGYRQGMHEILAPLLFELHLDRKFAPVNLSETLKYYLDVNYLEHHSYMLFNAVMKGMEKFYTTGDVVPSASGRLPTCKVVHNPNEVVRYLEKVKDEYLVSCDSQLATRLVEHNISLELFGIRWLRLLFGREFPRAEIPHLWGFLFADGPMLPHLHYFVVAMLVSLRDTLLSVEAGFALSVLMRPSPLPAAHVMALALSLRRPRHYLRPLPMRPLAPSPDPVPASHRRRRSSYSDSDTSPWCVVPAAAEQRSGALPVAEAAEAAEAAGAVAEGVAEGADVARELAALALLRARLPPAAAALHAALPRVPPRAAAPLHQILQLAALLQCRNHALVDVETALEAAEGDASEKVGRQEIVPIAVVPKRSPMKAPTDTKQPSGAKEVQLKVFHQTECKTTSDFPFLDPLRTRTD
ncbi:TBC1 domain family member 5 [Galleria mellonella]|uniref:TBC1 domain family member 5 n=1 Tax=Galleria mellonella TaxID=7137 RepID=A0ABM3MQT2_GALME|nr:TBC1 domain family member 5 [Galleria mellonella]